MDSHDDLWIHMVSDMMMKPPKCLFFLWFQMNTVKVNENYNLHDWGTQEWGKNQEKRSQFTQNNRKNRSNKKGHLHETTHM